MQAIRETTPQERLEIREFILDANLYLISNSFLLLSYLAGYLYVVICYCYYKCFIEIELFMGATYLFIGVLLTIALGYRSISSQKRYISRLDSVFEEVEDV